MKDDEKKQAILLSLCGVSTYTVIWNLLAPELPSMKSFDTIVAAAGKHFNPKPSSIVLHFRFNSCIQKDGESVAEFVSQLRHLSKHCEFGNTLDHMLRDRIVYGINDPRIQCHLLAETELTLAKALELSLAIKTADKDVATLKAGATDTSTDPVLRMPATAGRGGHTHRNLSRDHVSNVICYQCHEKHLTTTCWFKQAQCHSCGRKSHISKACQGRQKPEEASCPQKRSQILTMNEQMEADSDLDDLSYTLFSMGSQAGTPIQINLTVNQKLLTMELDMGASYSLISEQMYKATWPERDAPVLQQSSVKLHTYTGKQVEVVGSITVTVCYNTQVV